MRCLGVWNQGKALVRPTGRGGAGAEADSPAHRLIRQRHGQWLEAAQALTPLPCLGGCCPRREEGAMSRSSLPCCCPPCRGFVEGSVLSAQRAARGGKPTSGSRPTAPASPELPEPGGAGATLSLVPREAGRVPARGGTGKVKCRKVLGVGGQVAEPEADTRAGSFDLPAEVVRCPGAHLLPRAGAAGAKGQRRGVGVTGLAVRDRPVLLTLRSSDRSSYTV